MPLTHGALISCDLRLKQMTSLEARHDQVRLTQFLDSTPTSKVKRKGKTLSQAHTYKYKHIYSIKGAMQMN